MTKHQKGLIPGRSSTQQFLFYKTDAAPGIAEADSRPKADPDHLAPAFEEVLTDNALIEAAMSHLASFSKFGAMVIRLDNSSQEENESEQNLIPEIMADVAKTIDDICKEENGVWGQIEQNTFGCFLPEKNAENCLRLSEKIQNYLEEHQGQTVTVGIAVYPTKNFKKRQIIENARKALDHAAFFGPKSAVCFDAVSLNISGDKRYQLGDLNGAIEEYKLALMLNPSDINVHNSLGVCYGELEDFDRALEEFETAIWLDSEEVMAIYNAGVANLFLANKNKALEYFLAAYRLEENVFEVLFQTGKLYLEMGENEKAKNLFEKAVELRPDSPAAYRFLGECFEAANKTETAIQAYKKAVKLNPNDAASLSSLGYLFHIQGENPEVATVFCQKSVEISPETPLFRNRLGQLYLKENRLDDALKEFEEAEKLGFDATGYIEKIKKQKIEELGN
ncbi:MAG: tetratricopeptide repeat protein [Deltaproteobacteria bacterium]|nr:tetratricopeptide repeat protein [Deltaproteobacteria bacterium]